MVEGTSEYHVFSRESVSRRLARVISSDTTRSTAADKAPATPSSATSPSRAPSIIARPMNAAAAASNPRQPTRSIPVAAPARPVSSG